MSQRSILSDELYSLRLQKPNTYLFGVLPYKVGLYNLRYKKYQKDTSNFQITHKVVERPVVYDSALTLASGERMKSFLQSQGYFYAQVKDTVRFKKRKAYVQYKVNTGILYYIDSLKYEIADPAMRTLVPTILGSSLFRRNSVYSNALAGQERERIADLVTNYGYYKFSVDNISFELDTLAGKKQQTKDPYVQVIEDFVEKAMDKEHKVDIKTTIRLAEDSLAFHRYTYNKVTVVMNYADSLKTSDYDTAIYNGLNFRFHKKYVHFSILDKKILIRPGDLFSQNNYARTLRQLNDLGIFQYVRIYMVEVPGDESHTKLNCYIVMTPGQKYNFQTNVEVSGGDLYVLGTAANVSVMDNNFLRGANQLTTTLSYGLELNQNKTSDLPFLRQFYLFSRNIGFNLRLDFPKFLLPFKMTKFSRRADPRTFVEAGVNSLRRIDYFSLRTFNGSYGYQWNATDTRSWTVTPIAINTLHLSNVDPQFEARMDSIPAIRHSYQETFIEGEEVKMEINTAGKKRNKYAFLRLGLEESGALMSGVKGLSHLVGNPLSINSAHYVRFDFDGRQYFLGSSSSFILRFAGGVGVPYDGSSVLPYIKQYFVGGAYSIRGWRPRVLGPGSYNAQTDNSIENLFIDQSGDIKLEWNVEYRFNLVKLFSGAVALNGAVFADAGNIWLARADDKLPGAEFRFNTLYQDIAVSPGAGIRMDLGGFLVLRLDWAFPIKEPYVMDNHGWVIDKIDFTSREWRRQNMNLNLAIGYPF